MNTIYCNLLQSGTIESLNILVNDEVLLVMIKPKYWALFAILPLFVGIMIGVSIQTSQAQLDEQRLGASLSPKSYGSATAGIVCGDRLCNEVTPAAPMPIVMSVIEDSMPDYMPSLGFKSLSKFLGDTSNTYTVEFTVTAAERNLKSIKIICKTDVETIETEVSNLSALETTTNVLRIRAMDPASITGEIISFQIARGASAIPFDPMSKDAPGHAGIRAEGTTPELSTRGVQAVPEDVPSLTLKQMQLQDMSGDEPQVSTKGFVAKGPLADAETFRAVYTVANVGGGDVQNVAIVVSSDVETVSATLQGFLDPKHSTIAVMIKAYDPFSITAKIVSFES